MSIEAIKQTINNNREEELQKWKSMWEESRIYCSHSGRYEKFYLSGHNAV
jgi:hypothetical protein